MKNSDTFWVLIWTLNCWSVPSIWFITKTGYWLLLPDLLLKWSVKNTVQSRNIHELHQRYIFLWDDGWDDGDGVYGFFTVPGDTPCWYLNGPVHQWILYFSDTALWAIPPAILRRNRIHLWILADNWFCYWIQKFQQFLINLSFTLMLSSNTALPWRRIHAYSGEDTDTSTSEFVFMEGLKKFEQIFQEVLLYSGLSPDHAKILSQRMLSIYQGYLLLERISNNTFFLKNARKNMLEMYREYRSYHEIWREPIWVQ